MNIEESKINLKNLICEYKRTIQLYGDFFIGLQEIQAIETLLTAYEKEKEKNENLIKERATEIVYVDKNFIPFSNKYFSYPITFII